MTDNTTATAQKNVLILNFIQSIFITEKNKNVSLPSTQLVAKRSNVFFYAFQPEENDDMKTGRQQAVLRMVSGAKLRLSKKTRKAAALKNRKQKA